MQSHEIVKMKVSDLKEAPYNPRKISEEALKGLTRSIEEFGVVEIPIYNKRTGHIVGGHQRKKAAMRLGIEEIDVVVVDLPEDKEKVLNVALNSPTISGEFDSKIDSLLNDIKNDNLDLFQDLMFNDLSKNFEMPAFSLESFGIGDEAEEKEEVETSITKAKTQPGDIWVLEAHQLICASAGEPDTYARVLGPKKCHLAITAQPFSEQRKRDKFHKPLTISNGSYPSYLRQTDELIRQHLINKDMWLGAGTMMVDALEDLYPSEEVNIEEDSLKDKFKGLAISSPIQSFLISKYTNKYDLVLDPIAGVGTILMLCTDLGRNFIGIEYIPAYCDIIIKKWQKKTGKKAYLASSGKLFDSIEVS